MKSGWKQIIKSALVGTNRTPFRTGDSGLMYSPTASDDQQLLENIAQASILQKTALPPEEYPEEIPEKAPANDLPPLSWAATQDLLQIVNGNYEKAIEEFLITCQNAKRHLPIILLPELLNIGLKKASLRPYILKTMDNRGAWLANQNEEWAYAGQVFEEELWQLGSLEERVSYLRHIREENPSKAIQLIRSTFEEDRSREKVAFLKLLWVNLSKEDEPFLEFCLDNGKKEIRHITSRLLSKIIDADLVNRMVGRALSCMTVKKKFAGQPKLVITLPEKVTADMIRDGIDPGAKWFKGGVKASRLGQIIVLIRPEIWQDKFKLSPKKVIEMFVRSDWSELLLQAIVEATAFHKNSAWMDLLVDFWLQNRTKDRWKQFDIDPLLAALPEKSFNRAVINTLSSEKDILSESHPITQLLKNTKLSWSDELTIKLIKSFSLWMSKETSKYWNGWHYRSILKNGAYRANPKVAVKLNHLWPRNSRIWGNWENEVMEFIQILNFRANMHKHINQS